MPRCLHVVRNPETCHECSQYLLRCAEAELRAATSADIVLDDVREALGLEPGAEIVPAVRQLQQQLAEERREGDKLVDAVAARLYATSEPWRFERWTGDGWSWPTLDDCREYVRAAQKAVAIDAAREAGEG